MEMCGLYVDYSGTMNECEVKIGNSESFCCERAEKWKASSYSMVVRSRDFCFALFMIVVCVC